MTMFPSQNVNAHLVNVSVTDQGEVWETCTERERDTYVGMGNSGVSAVSYSVLIDLSDTQQWPHQYTGRIDLSSVYLQADRDATGTGRIRVGVITSITNTNADITYFSGLSFQKSDQRHLERDRHFTPSQMKCGVSAGKVTRMLTSGRESTTAVKANVSISSPLGPASVLPAKGDIVVQWDWVAGSYDGTVAAFYHSEATN